MRTCVCVFLASIFVIEAVRGREIVKMRGRGRQGESERGRREREKRKKREWENRRSREKEKERKRERGNMFEGCVREKKREKKTETPEKTISVSVCFMRRFWSAPPKKFPPKKLKLCIHEYMNT